MKKESAPRVFFNASVILAALKSPTGGSAELLSYINEKKIKGVISEIILNEVIRNSAKIQKTEKEIKKHLAAAFPSVVLAPTKSLVEKYKNIVIDYGDAHVLACAIGRKCDFLVSLDQKHILILKDKIKPVKIVSPKDLIMLLS